MAIDPEVVKLWFHYEEIAMHFNELIIQYRLQLLGGLGALSAVLTYFVGNKVDEHERFLSIRAYTSSVVLIIFMALASLDIFYYSQLNCTLKELFACLSVEPSLL